MSPESRHYRFLGGTQELSPDLLKKFCNVDGQHSMAFVADEWQHKGLGTLLARQLIDFAKGHGVRKLYSLDLADNTRMRHLAVIYSLTLS